MHKNTRKKNGELVAEGKADGKDLADKIMDNADFIAVFNITKRTAQRWRKAGKIGYIPIGKKVYYLKSDVDMMMEKLYVGQKDYVPSSVLFM